MNVNDFRRQETQPTTQPQPKEDDEFKPRLPKYSLNRDEVIPEANYVMRYAEPPNIRRLIIFPSLFSYYCFVFRRK